MVLEGVGEKGYKIVCLGDVRMDFMRIVNLCEVSGMKEIMDEEENHLPCKLTVSQDDSVHLDHTYSGSTAVIQTPAHAHAQVHPNNPDHASIPPPLNPLNNRNTNDTAAHLISQPRNIHNYRDKPNPSFFLSSLQG